MRKAFERYGFWFGAIAAIMVLGLAIASVILSNQRFYLPGWVPVIGTQFVDYTADFRTGKSVVPGQGQTVTISGVTIGEIGKVELHEGRGRVTMKIREEYADRIREDATAALRPRTPLQDMVIQLDPGTKTAPPLEPGGNIPASRTQVPVDFDEFVGEFDADTRAYLGALIRDGAKGLGDGGGKQLGDLLRGFEPTTVYGTRIAKALKERDQEAARAITSLKTVADALGDNSAALAGFVTNSADAFEALAGSREQLAGVVQKSPAALDSIQSLLRSGGRIGRDLGTAARRLERPTAKLDSGFRELIRFMDEAGPVIENDLRPFARDVQPTLRKLKPAVDDLAGNSRHAATGTTVLRQFFDGIAYEPPGPDYSALTLMGYLGHAGMSITGLQDAAGTATRTMILADCGLVATGFKLIRANDPVARVISDLIGLPNETTVLGNGKTTAQYCAETGQQ